MFSNTDDFVPQEGQDEFLFDDEEQRSSALDCSREHYWFDLHNESLLQDSFALQDSFSLQDSVCHEENTLHVGNPLDIDHAFDLGTNALGLYNALDLHNPSLHQTDTDTSAEPNQKYTAPHTRDRPEFLWDIGSVMMNTHPDILGSTCSITSSNNFDKEYIWDIPSLINSPSSLACPSLPATPLLFPTDLPDINNQPLDLGPPAHIWDVTVDTTRPLESGWYDDLSESVHSLDSVESVQSGENVESVEFVDVAAERLGMPHPPPPPPPPPSPTLLAESVELVESAEAFVVPAPTPPSSALPAIQAPVPALPTVHWTLNWLPGPPRTPQLDPIALSEALYGTLTPSRSQSRAQFLADDESIPPLSLSPELSSSFESHETQWKDTPASPAFHSSWARPVVQPPEPPAPKTVVSEPQSMEMFELDVLRPHKERSTARCAPSGTQQQEQVPSTSKQIPTPASRYAQPDSLNSTDSSPSDTPTSIYPPLAIQQWTLVNHTEVEGQWMQSNVALGGADAGAGSGSLTRAVKLLSLERTWKKSKQSKQSRLSMGKQTVVGADIARPRSLVPALVE